MLMSAATVWLSQACAAASPPAGPRESMTTVLGLVGDAGCDDDAQCRTIAIGAKACGGPEAYLAWSVKRTDGAVLADAVARHAAARRKENSRTGQQSDCAVVTDPGAVCAPAETLSPSATQDAIRACRLRTMRRGAGVAPY